LRLSLVEGDVQVKAKDTSDWVAAAINTPLEEGDQIWVPAAGRAEIQSIDGSCVRLDENSSLEILTTESNSFQFYLAAGHAYVNFRGRKGSVLQMDTPVSSVRAYDRSKFRIDVADDGYTDISVFKGTVYAESQSGSTAVDEGNALSVGGEGSAELAPLGPSDEWEQWNMRRDSRLDARGRSYRYLPDDLNTYSYDFDENGRWVDTPDYGYVWTPTVVLSAGWSPYRLGRWTWFGNDYVWISYEPWGWVPYHYGRWSFVASIGWCWVPPVRGSVYWGPGFVGWVSTPSYVAWVPLAPGEIYYGYGNYGPGSVNIINVNINNIVVKNVYRNVNVLNAVSVINRNVFVRGKYVYERPRQNPFLTNRINIGRPDIKPGRNAFLPVVKQIPRSKLPPQSVRNIQVRELKRERPLVAERKASVLRPGSASKTMPVRKSKEPLRLEGRKFMGKGITPRKEIQPAGKKLPQRQIQPSEKQKPEGKAIERQRKAVETPPERLKERTVTPLEKRAVTPLEKRAVTPLEKRAVTPLEKRAVTPLEKRAVTPLEKRAVTPLEKRAVTPLEKRAVTPLEKRAVTPAEKRAVTPTEKRKVTPAEKRAVTPAEKRKVTPAEKRKVTPAEKRAVTPTEKRKVTPAEKTGGKILEKPPKGQEKEQNKKEDTTIVR